MKKSIIKIINSVPESAVRTVELRLKEFERVRNSSGKAWFSELCFCILTANSRADTAIRIQKKLGAEGFLKKRRGEIEKAVRGEGHRFYRKKAEFIVGARRHGDIKRKVNEIISACNDELEGTRKAREWIAKNIKGLGMKEASHFLRNVGFPHAAILDRHVLRFMKGYGLIEEIPKNVSVRKYLEAEAVLDEICRSTGKSQGELDFYMWFLMTGRILK